MNKFWNDYWQLCAESLRFGKNHWLGILVWWAITSIGVYLYYLIQYGIWCSDIVERVYQKIVKLVHKA